MRKTIAIALILAASAHADGEWAPGVKYTTDWKRAIAEARATGKMLMIYNGWQKSGI